MFKIFGQILLKDDSDARRSPGRKVLTRNAKEPDIMDRNALPRISELISQCLRLRETGTNIN